MKHIVGPTPLISLHVTSTSYEYNVQIGEYKLNHVHDLKTGHKYNEATKVCETHEEIIDYNAPEMKPLFIALHNYKAQNGKI